MSMTKLPEAFAEKKTIDAPDGYNYTETMGAWADGYNACLEATGAKELWEALRELELFVRVLGLDSEPARQAAENARAALKSNTPEHGN